MFLVIHYSWLYWVHLIFLHYNKLIEYWVREIFFLPEGMSSRFFPGPIFFLAYVFFVFFVLLNMFLAIINDTYMEVKAELQNKKSRFDIGQFVKQGYSKMRDRLTAKHDRLADIRKALSLADVNSDKRLEFEEWRNEMKSRGYAEEEIENMFAKYDKDGDRVLDEDEQRALTNDINQQKDAIVREMNELNMTVKNK